MNFGVSNFLRSLPQVDRIDSPSGPQKLTLRSGLDIEVYCEQVLLVASRLNIFQYSKFVSGRRLDQGHAMGFLTPPKLHFLAGFLG